MTVDIHDKWPLTLFGSPLSQYRRTDRTTFNQEKDSAELWKGITKGVQVVLTHGPMFDDMTQLGVGEHALDRDCIDKKDRGSSFLQKAIFGAEVDFAACGHIHGAAGHHGLEYSNGSTGLFVNAAAVIPGYNYETMKHVKESTDTEYAEPRVPTIVDWDPEKGTWTVVAKWDDTLAKVPRWA